MVLDSSINHSAIVSLCAQLACCAHLFSEG